MLVNVLDLSYQQLNETENIDKCFSKVLMALNDVQKLYHKIQLKYGSLIL